ncbi:MAG: hypothetical protein A3G25_18545 [Betaproteobacteria bacterium RIFCSPLOWO2_12_FULL_63_13]|nr:MAG: hypothetical protein A3G25_18545 [Betaproteobacteria bacterium RIFCSPLOWO2_12_FULL_63_13]OGT83942.1 MAG: hypothetical protein A3H91_06955 [Gammaproteobacteria bacterium RIFCSPLOWO2_02_FULL_61_13]
MDLKPFKLFVDGKWVEPAGGKYFETVNPATEKVITEVAEGDSRDVERVLEVAHRAFETGPWPRLAAPARRAILEKMALLLTRFS